MYIPRIFSGAVLQDNADKAKAYNAIHCMVELQRGGEKLGLNKLDTSAPVPVAVNKIPLPLSSEIMYCLDLLEAKSDICWEHLAAIQRLYSRIDSGELRVLNSQDDTGSRGIENTPPSHIFVLLFVLFCLTLSIVS